MAEEQRRRVLVGIDGSEASREALRFAAEEARMRDADLVAVTAWDAADWVWLAGAGGPVIPTEEHVDAARRIAETTVNQVLGTDRGGLTVVIEAPQSSPASALVDRSRDAALLVVGSRGRGGFRSLVLGSVSLQCVLHAACPVVVTPAPRAAEDVHDVPARVAAEARDDTWSDQVPPDRQETSATYL